MFADRALKGHVTPYPPTPAEVCGCVLKQVARGTNLYYGWGEERCKQCNKWIQWGHGV